MTSCPATMQFHKKNSGSQKFLFHHFLSFFIVGLNFSSMTVMGSSAKYCFYGNDVNSQEALSNQTCETSETHLSHSLSGGDQSPNLSKMSHNHSTLSSPDGGNCFIFRHLSSIDLSPETKKETIQVTFGCDYATVCLEKQADTLLNKVNYRGHIGQLYCCSSDNCNSISKMPHLPAENRICYNGTSNSSQVDLESCGHPDVFCVKLTHFFPDGKLETYSCDAHDNHRQCNPDSMNGAIRVCENSTVDGIIQQLCCCDGNKCNQPSNPRLLINDKDSTDRSSFDSGGGKISHPIGNPHSQDKSNKVITGLVAAVVILVFTGIVIILVTAYKKGKQRSTMRRDPNVIMQYERLSGSEPDIEDAVVV